MLRVFKSTAGPRWPATRPSKSQTRFQLNVESGYMANFGSGSIDPECHTIIQTDVTLVSMFHLGARNLILRHRFSGGSGLRLRGCGGRGCPKKKRQILTVVVGRGSNSDFEPINTKFVQYLHGAKFGWPKLVFSWRGRIRLSRSLSTGSFFWVWKSANVLMSTTWYSGRGGGALQSLFPRRRFSQS